MEHKNLIKLAQQILKVHTCSCSHCGQTCDYILESADTDLVSCYCGSAYSPSDRRLVLAETTMDEYRYGISGRLDVRVDAMLAKQDYRCHEWTVCPFCGKAVEEQAAHVSSLEAYCRLHPNTLIVYADGTVTELLPELEQSHTE